MTSPNETKYPQRPKMFIVEFIDAMIAADVAAKLGADVAWLLMVIVRQEDRNFYKRMADYWNSQLRNHLGCSEKKLRNIRKKAIDAGWLAYFPTVNGDHSPAKYFVTIPSGTPCKSSQGTLFQNAQGTPCSSIQGPRAKRAIDPVQNGTSSIPTTSIPKEPTYCQKLRFDEEDLKIAEWMFSKIQELNPGHRKPNLEKWANAIRLLRERDNRSPTAIRELFVWANADDFWRSNILSPAKLREQWDRLQIKRQEKGTKNGFTLNAGNQYDESHHGTW